MPIYTAAVWAWLGKAVVGVKGGSGALEEWKGLVGFKHRVTQGKRGWQQPTTDQMMC